jgi:hypothetical protein
MGDQKFYLMALMASLMAADKIPPKNRNLRPQDRERKFTPAFALLATEMMEKLERTEQPI